MGDEPVSVASVHRGLTKTMLEACVETQVHQVEEVHRDAMSTLHEERAVLGTLDAVSTLEASLATTFGHSAIAAMSSSHFA